jgi:hypothetical protein
VLKVSAFRRFGVLTLNAITLKRGTDCAGFLLDALFVETRLVSTLGFVLRDKCSWSNQQTANAVGARKDLKGEISPLDCSSECQVPRSTLTPCP